MNSRSQIFATSLALSTPLVYFLPFVFAPVYVFAAPREDARVCEQYQIRP